MKMILQFASVVTLAFASYSASANELIMTSAKSSNAGAISLDIASDGAATALQLRLDVGDGLKVDLSDCVSGLPSTHTGVCAYKNGRVTVLVHSDKNEMLPAGIVSIGSIKTSGGSARAKGVAVAELMAFDRSGNEVSISSVLDRDSMDSAVAK